MKFPSKISCSRKVDTMDAARSAGLSLVAAFTLALALPQAANTAEPEMSGEALYQQSCASCHGAQLQGGQAQSLVDAIWQFGSGSGAMFRNIKFGIADFSMPAFEKGLSDAQIQSVIQYILSQEKAVGATRPAPPESIHTLDYEVKVKVVTDQVELPWGIAFLNENQILVTERAGRLRLIENGQLLPTPVLDTPDVLAQGQGGLLDVAVDPNSCLGGWIYLSYSHEIPAAPGKDRTTAMTRIVRGKIRDHRWVDQQVLFEAPHDLYLETRHHYGSRIVFDPQGHLYFSIGERGLADQAQDLKRPNGKIHRIFPDGTIPKDNPFVSQTGVLPSIFTYGNRNPQGLAVHPVTGQVWESEHGPMGGDELNLIQAGANYGWPVATYGRNYDGAKVSDLREREDLTAPSLYWNPSIAVCGMDFVQGKTFPRWSNHLLVSALKYEEIRLLHLKGDRVLHQEILLKNAGRVRDVGCSPSGIIYAVLNGPDMILQLTPLRDLNEVD